MDSEKAFVIEPYQPHVRVRYQDRDIAETSRALLLIESYAPDIYIPFEDIDMSRVMKTETISSCSKKGSASLWTIEGSAGAAVDAMWAYESPLPKFAKLSGYAAFDFNQIETLVDNDNASYNGDSR